MPKPADTPTIVVPGLEITDQAAFEAWLDSRAHDAACAAHDEGMFCCLDLLVPEESRPGHESRRRMAEHEATPHEVTWVCDNCAKREKATSSPLAAKIPPTDWQIVNGRMLCTDCQTSTASGTGQAHDAQISTE